MPEPGILMIDLHCHILPNIDHDGPNDIEEVLGMAKLAVNDGIQTVVATPHLQHHNCSTLPFNLQVDELNHTLEEEAIPLRVVPGAEVEANLSHHVLCNHTINGKGYVLLEFSRRDTAETIADIVYETSIDGLLPIVAHAERLPSIQQNPSVAKLLIDSGAYIQLTADSLTGGYGIEARICAYQLVRNKFVHFLGSDGHSQSRRKPVMSQGLAVAAGIIGKPDAIKLVSNNPASVICGNRIEV